MQDPHDENTLYEEEASNYPHRQTCASSGRRACSQRVATLTEARRAAKDLLLNIPLDHRPPRAWHPQLLALLLRSSSMAAAAFTSHAPHEALEPLSAAGITFKAGTAQRLQTSSCNTSSSGPNSMTQVPPSSQTTSSPSMLWRLWSAMPNHTPRRETSGKRWQMRASGTRQSLENLWTPWLTASLHNPVNKQQSSAPRCQDASSWWRPRHCHRPAHAPNGRPVILPTSKPRLDGHSALASDTTPTCSRFQVQSEAMPCR